MDKTWFTLEARGKGKADMNLYGDIGAWGITAADFSKELRDLGDLSVLNLYINSNGGEVFTGMSIYNMLARMNATIHVHIDGVAASIASVIAMVGDTINIADNGMLMIHNPAGWVSGDSRDMRQIANVLDKIKNNVIDIYAKKSGKSRDKIWQWMDDETWFTAQEALDEGFVTKITEAVEITNSLDFTRFINPPANMNAGTKRSNGAPLNHGGSDMTTKTTPGADPKVVETEAEMRARITTEVTAQLKADAEKPKPETEAEMRARIAGEITDYRNQVTDICNLAGRPDLIDGFVNENKPVADVIAAIKAAANDPKAKKTSGQAPANGNGEISNRNAPANGEGEAVIDTASIYNRWNAPKKRSA